MPILDGGLLRSTPPDAYGVRDGLKSLGLLGISNQGRWRGSCATNLMRRALTVFITLALGFVCGCGSAATSTTAPSPSGTRCAISATPSPSSFPPSGGSGNIAIAGARECVWTISADTTWIVPEQTEGQGAATLPFRVSANGTPNQRRGTLSIGSTRVELAQDGAPCRFDLDTGRAEVPATGGDFRIAVTAMTGCAWSARPLDVWINVAAGGSADGSGVIQLSAAANGGPARQGSVTVANQTVTVTQPASIPGTPPGGGGTGGGGNPPAKGRKVEIDGRVGSLRGACPNLTFAVNGSTIFTDGKTGYRGGDCKHVENGLPVIVSGEESGGRVNAERVDLKGRK